MKIKIEIEIDTVDDHDEILDLIKFVKDKFKLVPSDKKPPKEESHNDAKK